MAFLNDPRAKYVEENYYLSPNMSDVIQIDQTQSQHREIKMNPQVNITPFYVSSLFRMIKNIYNKDNVYFEN